MMLIMNCLEEENRAVVGGNTFTFAPKQIKPFYNDNLARLLETNRGEDGFISLPIELEYLCHLRPGETVDSIISKEHNELLVEKRQEGVNRFVENLRRRVYNAQVSVKHDLDKMGIKADSRAYSSDQDLKNLELLVKYQTKQEDASKARIDRIKELEKTLEKQVK